MECLQNNNFVFIFTMFKVFEKGNKSKKLYVKLQEKYLISVSHSGVDRPCYSSISEHVVFCLHCFTNSNTIISMMKWYLYCAQVIFRLVFGQGLVPGRRGSQQDSCHSQTYGSTYKHPQSEASHTPAPSAFFLSPRAPNHTHILTY